MSRVTFEVRTALSPDKVIAMLTDFTDRRPDLWPMLEREFYKVHEASATSAIVEEGGPRRSGLWERVHYEWDKSGRVRWTILESNAFAPGGYVEVLVWPAAGHGSLVKVEWNRTGVNPRGWALAALVALTRGVVLRRKVYEQAFQRA
jgi:hypothetical protein